MQLVLSTNTLRLCTYAVLITYSIHPCTCFPWLTILYQTVSVSFLFTWVLSLFFCGLRSPIFCDYPLSAICCRFYLPSITVVQLQNCTSILVFMFCFFLLQTSYKHLVFFVDTFAFSFSCCTLFLLFCLVLTHLNFCICNSYAVNCIQISIKKKTDQKWLTYQK